MSQIDYSPSILLVEDDRVQQRVMRLMCERFGCTVSTVSSGDEAIQLFRFCSGRFDAVLMDWKMYGMSGIDTTSAIRKLEGKTERHVPIIAVTANVMAGDRERCLDAGMDDYLSEPFTVEQFRTMLLRWTYTAGCPNLKLFPRHTSAKSGIAEGNEFIH